MNFELAVEKVTYRFKELGYGCMFTFNELQKWLGIYIDYDGENHDFEYYKEQQKKITKGLEVVEVWEALNDQLIIEHNIYLEVDKDIQGFKVVLPSETRKRLALIQSKGRKPTS